VFDVEIEIIQLNVQIGQDEELLDELPHDPGHLVAVHFHQRRLDDDFLFFVHEVQLPVFSFFLISGRRMGWQQGRLPGAQGAATQDERKLPVRQLVSGREIASPGEVVDP